ncbi:MAG: CHASE4 domain-containing protein [Cyanobacteriota bacterium]
MTLRQRTLLSVGVTLLFLLLTLYLNLSTIWLDGFAKIESQMTHLNVERVTEAIVNDLEKLSSTASDWAGWDETYAFVEDGNKRYIQENLDAATFINLRLNLMLFVNKTGQIVYGTNFDLQRKAAIPVPDSLKQYLVTHPRLLQHQVASSSHTGIVLLPESPLVVASRPILKSDRTGRIRGTLIIGRFLDAAEVRQLSELTRSQLTLYPLQDKQLPADFQAVKKEITQDKSNTKTPTLSPILVRPLNPQRIAGYTLLKDIEGQPALLLRVDTSRDIYQQGKRGLRYLVIALLVVGLAFGCITLLLIEKSVLSPLARFSVTVRRIRDKGDLTERISIKGSDELSRVGIAINQLLATLQESQQQLSQNEERYRSVVNNVTEVIFQTDTAGRWTFLNPAWTEITGFNVEESLGKFCWTFIHPEDKPYHEEQFRHQMAGKTQNTRYCVRYQTYEGSYRWFEVHSRLTFSYSGCEYVTGIGGTLNDITERRLAEAREREKTQELEKTLLELTHTQAQLFQSEKLSILGQLVAGVAHEINNPLISVSVNMHHATEYFQDLLHLINCYQQYYPNPPEEIKLKMEAIDFEFMVDDLPNLLNSMKTGSERICEIVQSLRNFSRLNESEMRAVDIHEGIESTLLILRHRFKAQGKYAEVELIKEYGGLPLVECYPGQVNQVLMNLIVNAIDALEEKRVKKSYEACEAPPFIRIRTEIKNKDVASNVNSGASHVLICIADNGTGITAEVSQHLFEPFFTTKPIGKGTGFGLSISYRIVVEKHQGHLYVQSEPGQGTEFIIELPIQHCC